MNTTIHLICGSETLNTVVFSAIGENNTIERAIKFANEAATWIDHEITSWRGDLGGEMKAWVSSKSCKYPGHDPRYSEAIKTEGFNTPVSTVGLHFLVSAPIEFGSRKYQLHVFHGHPAYANWWENGTHVLANDISLEDAKKMIDMLVGIRGAHQYFPFAHRGSNNHDQLSLLSYE